MNPIEKSRTNLFSGFKRLGKFALDPDSIFDNYDLANNYILDSKRNSYEGQVIVIKNTIDDKKAGIYLNLNNSLIRFLDYEDGDNLNEKIDALNKIIEDIKDQISAIEARLDSLSDSYYDKETIDALLKEITEKFSGYYTKTEIDEELKKIISLIPDDFYTKKEIENLLKLKADKTEIPKKISELENDSGFITKDVENLENYYNKTEIDNKLSTIHRYKGSCTYSELISKIDAELGDVWTVTDKDNSEYVCVKAKIPGEASWEPLGMNIDLKGYYTKDEIDNFLSSKAESVHTHKASDILDLDKSFKTINNTSILGNGDIQIPFVKANTDLTGDEEIISSLSINDVTYKIAPPGISEIPTATIEDIDALFENEGV